MVGIKQKGGTLNNPTGVTISGYLYGIYIYGSKGSVTNSGSIVATGVEGLGVELLEGGSLTNNVGAIRVTVHLPPHGIEFSHALWSAVAA